MAIVWCNDLKTGIAAIDEQHQLLIEMIGKIEESKKLEESLLNKLLFDLQACASVHFVTEEDYMIDAKYPGYNEHKSNHDKVLSDFENALTKITSGYSVCEVALDVLDYIENWFEGHYSNEDVKMAEYLKANSWQIS